MCKAEVYIKRSTFLKEKFMALIILDRNIALCCSKGKRQQFLIQFNCIKFIIKSKETEVGKV